MANETTLFNALGLSKSKVIDGFGSTSTSEASSINNVTNLNDRLTNVETKQANDKGFFIDENALITAFPVGQAGWFALIGSTDTNWVWDVETLAWIDTAEKAYTGVIDDSLTTSLIRTYSVDKLNSTFATQTALNGKNIKSWFVSGGVNGSGNDLNNGYKPDNAFLTLAKLNSVMGNDGQQAVLCPTQLTESAIFNQFNIEVTGFNASHRGICGTSGTLTSNNGISGSQTYSYLGLGGFAKTGAGYVRLFDLDISTSFSDSSSGVLDAWNCQFNATTPISITGSGNKNFYNQRGGIFTVNNASALVNVITNDFISQFTLTAGLLAIKDAIIYIAQGTTFTIGASGSTFIGNNVTFLYPDNTKAKINIPSGVNYSLQNNCVYDIANSTLNGTDISSLYQGYFASIAVKALNLPNLTINTVLATDANKNIQSLSVATYPSLTELSYVKGVTSSIQAQINAISGGGGNSLRARVVNATFAVYVGSAPSTLTIYSDIVQPNWTLQGVPAGFTVSSPTISTWATGNTNAQNYKIDFTITPPASTSVAQTTVYYGGSSVDIANTNNYQGTITMQATTRVAAGYTTAVSGFGNDTQTITFAKADFDGTNPDGTNISRLYTFGNVNGWRVVDIPTGALKCYVYALGGAGGGHNESGTVSAGGCGAYVKYVFNCTGYNGWKLLVATGLGGFRGINGESADVNAIPSQAQGAFPAGGRRNNYYYAATWKSGGSGGGRSEVRLIQTIAGATPTLTELAQSLSLCIASGGGGGHSASSGQAGQGATNTPTPSFGSPPGGTGTFLSGGDSPYNNIDRGNWYWGGAGGDGLVGGGVGSSGGAIGYGGRSMINTRSSFPAGQIYASESNIFTGSLATKNTQAQTDYTAELTFAGSGAISFVNYGNGVLDSNGQNGLVNILFDIV